MSATAFVSQASRRWAHELDDSILRWVARYAPTELPPERGSLRHITAEKLARILANEDIPFSALAALKGEAAAINNDLIRRSHQLRHEGYSPKQVTHLKRQRREIGGKLQVIDAEISRRRHLVIERSKGQEVLPLPYAFMDVVRESLPADEFERLRMLAVERRDRELGLL